MLMIHILVGDFKIDPPFNKNDAILFAVANIRYIECCSTDLKMKVSKNLRLLIGKNERINVGFMKVKKN